MLSPARGRRARRPRASRSVLMLCLFAFMLLMPAVANASVGGQLDAGREARAQATETPPEEVVEPTEEPMVEPTEEPAVETTEEPLIEATEAIDATEEPQGEQLGAFEIDYWECAPDYDIANPDLDNLFQDCEGVDGIQFQLEASDGGTDSQATGEFGDAHVSFTEVPTGSTTVRQVSPVGQIAVYCNGIVQNGGPETGLMTVPVQDGAIDWDLVDEEVVFCSWLTTAGGEQVGAIEIEYRECAEGYAFLDGTDEDDLDQMLMECAQVDGVEFTIDEGGPDGATQQTGEFGDSHVSFTEVPTGLRTVTQTTPFADTYVVCEGIVQNGGPETGVMEMTVTGGAIEWNLLDDEVAFCNWFVIGAGDLLDATEMPGTETATDEPGDGNTLTLYKWDCPAGTEYGGELDDYEAECATQLTGVPFVLTDGTGERPDLSQADGTQWNDVVVGQEGELQLVEEIPTGYGDPVVYCWSNDGDPALVDSANGFVVPQPELDNERFDYYCLWYNIPEGDATVIINTWECAEGYLPDPANVAGLAENCPDPQDGVTFHLSGETGGESSKVTSGGTAQFAAPADEIVTVTEEVPGGYGTPVVRCTILNSDDGLVADLGVMAIANSASITTDPLTIGEGNRLVCDWYNVHGRDTTVELFKWICPQGTTYDEEFEWYAGNCTEWTDEIEFTLTTVEGNSSKFPTSGVVEWTDVPTGEIGIQEQIPDQYGEPVVWCSANGSDPERFPAPTGFIAWETFGQSGDESDYRFSCHWFNIEGGPGEITVEKYTCPEGYDLHAWGANPEEDCPEATNGVNFTLVDEDPGTVDLQTMTGDSIDGAVYFGGLEPGPYTIIETVPPGTEYVFVLDCYGQQMGELRPYPLSMGDTLEIDLGAGESITCSWYNVPEYDPDYGRITVYKYDCWTPEYTSDVDCEIYEDGKAFDLVYWDGDSWEYADTETTDGAGKIMWINVDPGEYWLDEQDGDWCHLESEQISDDGNWINVYADQETVIEVYNCGGKKPGAPGKTPTKYPNTGVRPGQGPDFPAELPAIAPLAGLLGLLATRRKGDQSFNHNVGEGQRSLSRGVSRGMPSRANPEVSMSRTVSRRKLAALLTLPLGGTALVRSGLLAQADQAIEPLEGSPAAGTPTSLCLPATPARPGDGEGDGGGDGQGSGQGDGQDDGDESTSAADECLRGAVPFTLRIEAIGVDAPVEILETVGGVMQQPSDEVHVAWYKETARLGELGNMLIAGHLNWWGVPEAVFFNLGTLREGDQVVVLDEEENAYAYEIEWVRQESNLAPPAEEVLGMTKYEAVTLMTCGGQWDSSISEYDERTVARAKRVPDGGTPEA